MLVGGDWNHGTFYDFPITLGISSSQLTNSIISEGLFYHQPDKVICSVVNFDPLIHWCIYDVDDDVVDDDDGRIVIYVICTFYGFDCGDQKVTSIKSLLVTCLNSLESIDASGRAPVRSENLQHIWTVPSP